MQNEFEKQVQQKMQELNLVPSAPVWQKVEKQIRKKKERRRFLFFILLPALLIGTGIWYAVDRSDGNSIRRKNMAATDNLVDGTKNKAAAAKENHEKPTAAIQNTQSVQISTTSNDVVKSKDADLEIKKEKTISEKTVPGKNTISVTKARGNDHLTATVYSPKSKTGKIKKESRILENRNKTVLKNTDKEEQDKTYHSSDVSFTLSKNKEKDTTIIPDSTSVTTNNIPAQANEVVDKKDSAPEIKTNKDSSIQNPIKTDSASKKKIAGTKKWSKLVSVQLGQSKYSSGFLSGGGALRDAFASPSYNTGGGVAMPFDSSKNILTGFSFAIGTEFRKEFTKRFSLGLGLYYHYYSVNTVVGALKRQDTVLQYNNSALAVRNFYTNARQTEFTNKYGVLEIPVSVNYQLFKNVPLHLSAGASYGRLIKTNALSREASSGLYYYNEENQVKNYLNIFSSLQYGFLLKNKMKLNLGPSIQYTPTELQKENRYTIPHLFFAGLKTDIIF